MAYFALILPILLATEQALPWQQLKTHDLLQRTMVLLLSSPLFIWLVQCVCSEMAL